MIKKSKILAGISAGAICIGAAALGMLNKPVFKTNAEEIERTIHVNKDTVTHLDGTYYYVLSDEGNRIGLQGTAIQEGQEDLIVLDEQFEMVFVGYQMADYQMYNMARMVTATIKLGDITGSNLKIDAYGTGAAYSGIYDSSYSGQTIEVNDVGGNGFLMYMQNEGVGIIKSITITYSC